MDFVSQDNIRQNFFLCQLAHDDEVKIIPAFNDVNELHQNVAAAFGLSPVSIMYCTRNTPDVDIDQIITERIYPGDIIYAHIRGASTMLRMVKETETFGVTLNDTGTGTVFIERVHAEGTFDYASKFHNNLIFVGCQIDSANDILFIGARKRTVEDYLDDIPIGSVVNIEVTYPKLNLKQISVNPIATNQELSAQTPIVIPQLTAQTPIVIPQLSAQQITYNPQPMAQMINYIPQPIATIQTKCSPPIVIPEIVDPKLDIIKRQILKKMGKVDDNLAKIIFSLIPRSSSAFDLTVKVYRACGKDICPEMLLDIWRKIYPGSIIL